MSRKATRGAAWLAAAQIGQRLLGYQPRRTLDEALRQIIEHGKAAMSDQR